MSKFDAKTLSDLHEAHDVAQRLRLHRHRGWYRDLAAGGPATLELGGRRLAVQAVPASDAAAIARASCEYLRKYGSSSHAQAMVKPDMLSTTLRLEPR